MKNRPIRFLLLLAALFALVLPASAHGPYDSSVQLFILSDSLELNATLGMDGAKQVLLNGGLSEADATAALTTRGPSTRVDLSVDLASHFFELKSGDQMLKPNRLQVITDGLEASFTATYASLYSGDLEIRAHYFDGVEAMKPGAFTAMDENHNVKAVAMFSRSKPVATVKLTEPITAEAPKPALPATTASNNPPPIQAASSGEPHRQPATLLWAVGLLVVVVVVLILVRKISRAR